MRENAVKRTLAAGGVAGILDETFRVSGRSACEAVLAVAAGRAPRYVVNPEAFRHPRLKALSPR